MPTRRADKRLLPVATSPLSRVARVEPSRIRATVDGALVFADLTRRYLRFEAEGRMRRTESDADPGYPPGSAGGR